MYLMLSLRKPEIIARIYDWVYYYINNMFPSFLLLGFLRAEKYMCYIIKILSLNIPRKISILSLNSEIHKASPGFLGNSQ